MREQNVICDLCGDCSIEHLRSDSNWRQIDIRALSRIFGSYDVCPKCSKRVDRFLKTKITKRVNRSQRAETTKKNVKKKVRL